MKTVIYNIQTNEIINITEDNVDFSKLPNNQDGCPISFFEQTDDGKKHLANYYNN
jgi:hypothetical protein